MKIGVKTFDNLKFLKNFENKADFFEIQAIQSTPMSFYSSLNQFSLPFVIHAEHQSFGVNYADKSKFEFNLKSLNFARKIADLTNAKKIIVHPGNVGKGNPNCSKENSINFFKNINDSRILIENLPKKYENLCVTLEEIKEFIKLTKNGFCFDVNHAFSNGINYALVKNFIDLNPSHYHIGGQKNNSSIAHLPLKESDLDLHKILNQYPKNAEITLETKPNVEDTEEDLRIINEIIGKL